MTSLRPFPVPVVAAVGPGSQADDEAPAFLPMPQAMSTFQSPSLPEPEDLAAHSAALAVLRAAHRGLLERLAGADVPAIDLAPLADADRALVAQLLGEGEVAAQVTGDAGLRAQESVFAGVWRVLHLDRGVVVRDTLEIGAVPQGLIDAAAEDGLGWSADEQAPPPPDLMNAPSVLSELRDRQARWQPGQPAHVVNLTLLPLTGGDCLWLDARLAAGRVVILSRGYGNCRIVNTRLPRTWRVTYYNSQDLIILDTLEVGAMPEVACAATQDLEDSAERLAEVLDWAAQA